MVPPLTPRGVKLVLHDAQEAMDAEDDAEDFNMISPRLEAFLEDGAKSPRPKASPAVSGRGPKAAHNAKSSRFVKKKQQPRPALPSFEVDDVLDGDEKLDANETRQVLQQQKEAMAVEEGAARYAVVSPRLEKFLAE